jgi:hypothetical protein
VHTGSSAVAIKFFTVGLEDDDHFGGIDWQNIGFLVRAHFSSSNVGFDI